MSSPPHDADAPALPRCSVYIATEELVAGEPRELVARLGREGVRHVYVDGGSLIRSFLAADLIDDLTLSVVPVLLGDGIPLWTAHNPERRLVLESSRSWSSGLTQLRYRVQRTVAL